MKINFPSKYENIQVSEIPTKYLVYVLENESLYPLSIELKADIKFELIDRLHLNIEKEIKMMIPKEIENKIKLVFRTLSRKYHPDVSNNNSIGQAALNDFYNELINL